MPPATRLTDMHVCPMLTPGLPPIPHVGGGCRPQARYGWQNVLVPSSLRRRLRHNRSFTNAVH
jgi:hypothetical protein